MRPRCWRNRNRPDGAPQIAPTHACTIRTEKGCSENHGKQYICSHNQIERIFDSITFSVATEPQNRASTSRPASVACSDRRARQSASDSAMDYIAQNSCYFASNGRRCARELPALKCEHNTAAHSGNIIQALSQADSALNAGE